MIFMIYMQVGFLIIFVGNMQFAFFTCIIYLFQIFQLGFLPIVSIYRQILILSINEDEAAALGVNVTVLRFIILMIATLIVSSIICVTGLISFIGLIAPHIARLLTRRNDRYTYISSGLAGAIIMTLADIFARSVSSSELPVSIFTSLLGAPLLIILLIKANKKEVA